MARRRTKTESGEDLLIGRHFRPIARHPGALRLLDDAAWLKLPARHELVLTADAIVGGVHFFPDDPPDTVARKALGVNLSDLAAKGANLKLGGPADCETNAFCIPGLKKVYNLDLSGSFQALETSAVAPALDADTIDIALLFSTDGRIAANNYVLLQDDKHMLAADDVVPVVSKALSDTSGFAAAVNKITAKLTTNQLIALNKQYDVDKADPAVIAKGFLTKSKLI